MLLGYNTNGFAFHRLDDAIEIIADLGYRSVAITLDHHALNPYASGFEAGVVATRRQLERLGLASVIETGARFLLDARRKHEPTLISPEPAGRERRLEFLCRAADVAAVLGSRAVSFWAGVRQEGVASEDAQGWLIEGVQQLAEYADRRGVALAFEPEPGMHVETLAEAAELIHAICREDPSQTERAPLRVAAKRPEGSGCGLTVDVGHLWCNGETPIGERLEAAAPQVLNVHIEDMRRGVHEHLFFGEGEMDFADVFAGLRRLPAEMPVHVELSRHSANAVETARRAMTFLNQFV